MTNKANSLILQRRKEKGLSLRELGAITGLSSTLINKIEKGVQNLTVNTIKALAPALDLKEEDLYVKAEVEPPIEELLILTEESQRVLEEWIEKRNSIEVIKNEFRKEIYKSLEFHLPRLHPSQSFLKKELEGYSQLLLDLVELTASKDEVMQALMFYRILSPKIEELKEDFVRWENYVGKK